MFSAGPKLIVTITQTGECYPCAVGESLLGGMLRLGRSGIPAGCVNGGCGVCKVRIVDGQTHALGPISRAHVSLQEERAGFTLACRAGPVSDVRLEVAGRLKRRLPNPAGLPADVSSSFQPPT